MGKYAIDKYSVLHVIAGMIAYLMGVRFEIWILLNTIFEFLENTEIVTKYVGLGKDTMLNSVSDVIFSSIGWRIGYTLFHS